MFKPIIFSALLTIASVSIYAQSLPDYQSIRLEKPADYALADSSALLASTYLLTTPLVKDNIGRLKSMQFLIKWMGGTPDYTFSLDGPVTKISSGNVDIMGVYLAAMVKFCLENKSQSKDQKAIKLNAVKTLLAYCSDPAHGVKIKGELKKAMEADEKGELEKYLAV